MSTVHQGPDGLRIIHDPEGKTLGDRLYVTRGQKCVPFGNALTLKALGGILLTPTMRGWLMSFRSLYAKVGGKSTNTTVSSFWSDENYREWRRRQQAQRRRGG